MSNNIYDILKKIENLEGPRQTLTEGKKVKPDYIDIDKDGDKKEPMKKAVKDKAKSGMAEAVARVEQQLSEKYMGFKKSAAARENLGEETEQFRTIKQGAKDLGMGVADFAQGLATIATGGKLKSIEQQMADEKRREQRAIDRAAKEAGAEVGDRYHKQLIKTNPAYRDEYMSRVKDVRMPDTMRRIEKELQAKYDPMGGPMEESAVEESGLQAYLGKKKYGEQGMKALQKAGREGASKEKMAMIRAKHDKMDEGSYNEDMLSPKQKSFAALAEPKDKITYADKIAGAKKDKKTEGNKFTAGLANDNIKVGEKIPGTNAVKTKDIDEGTDGPEYQKTLKRTQDERKEWEKSYPDKKYFDQGPAERHQMELSKARDADQAAKDAKRSPLGRVANTLVRGLFGQELPEGRTSMREGWEEMQKYLEKKRGPESKGGAGKKAGTRYGGSAQKDDDEEMDGEGQPAVKKKGRPKGTGGGAKFNFKKPKD